MKRPHIVEADANARYADAALLFLRVSASLLVLIVHGLPKALHIREQIGAIEDPLHMGSAFTLAFAIFAEVVCPVLMIAGIFTRLAAVPILIVTVVALTLVHPDWSVGQGQFAWMLLILFGTVAIGGAGRYRLRLPLKNHARGHTRTSIH